MTEAKKLELVRLREDIARTKAQLSNLMRREDELLASVAPIAFAKPAPRRVYAE